MVKKSTDGLIAEPQPNNLNISKLIVNLANDYVRLGKCDRRKAMRVLKKFLLGKASSVSYWDRWSKDDMKCCYLQLQPISKKMANDFRRWAAELLKAERNNKLALICLIDDLEVRTWIEDPESGLYG